MRQVLLNLLDERARTLLRPRGDHAAISLLRDGVWRVIIEDQGIGVPAEQHERIFERFVRLDNHDDETGAAAWGSPSAAVSSRSTMGASGRERVTGAPGLRVLFGSRRRRCARLTGPPSLLPQQGEPATGELT